MTAEKINPVWLAVGVAMIVFILFALANTFKW